MPNTLIPGEVSAGGGRVPSLMLDAVSVGDRNRVFELSIAAGVERVTGRFRQSLCVVAGKVQSQIGR